MIRHRSPSFQFWFKVENIQTLKPIQKIRPEDIKRGAYSVPQILANEYTKVYFREEDAMFKIISDAPMCTQDDCTYRVIICKYRNAFESDGKTLTMEYIQRFIRSTNTKLSLKEIKPFFQAHRLPFTVLDAFGKIIFTYRPEEDGKKRNKHISNCHMFIMAVNEHVYDLNKNSRAIERTHFDEKQEDDTMRAPLPYARRPAPIELGIVCNDIRSLQKALCENGEGDKKVLISYTGNMEEAFLSFVRDHSYVPKIYTKNRIMTGMVMYNGDVSIRVQKADINIQDALGWKNRFHSVMFKGCFKSYYSDNVKIVFSEYRKAQLVRRFGDTPDDAHCYDVRRHYTWSICQVNKIPVFIWTDDFKKYDGHPLEDYTLYMVHNTFDDVEHWMIADREYSPVSGYVLSRCGLDFPILSFCRPSSVVDNPFIPLTKELYKSDAEKDTKKFVPLHTIGLLGKTNDHTERSVYTSSYQEALNLTDLQNITLASDLSGYYATQKSKSVVLENGYYPFQFMTYDIARLKMLEVYKTMISKGKQVYGILTDSLYVDSMDGIECSSGETFEDMGSLHYCGVKPVPHKQYAVTKNDNLIAIKERKHIDVDKKPEEGNVLIVATDAGAGKTYTSFLDLPKDQVLAVTPGNKQVCGLKTKYECDSMTVCKFLGERVVDGNETKETGRTLDLSKYKYIILDEFFQSPITDCSKLLRKISGLPHQIICNGDVFQNSNRETCTVPRQTYFDTVLPRFFPYRITLSGCRRMKLESDRALVSQLRMDLEAGMSIQNTIRKYKLQTVSTFEALQKVIREKKIKINITLENGTASVINQLYQDCVQPGDTVVCKRYFKSLTRNVLYTVEAVEDDCFRIGDKKYPKNGFRLPYAYTCHSVQGEDIDEAFIIYDVDHINANSNWFYTAITRATYLSNVIIYTGTSLGGAIDWQKKLQGYKEQDKKANRQFALTTQYVKELCSKANYCCIHCKNMVHMVYEEESGRQWTLDRIDDEKGHVEGNVHLSCWGCNRALGYLNKK